MSARQKRDLAATPQEAAVLSFEPWSTDDLPKLPSLEGWLEQAKTERTLTAFAVATMTKTKEELIQVFADGPELAMEALEWFTQAEERCKAGRKLFRAATVRMLIAGSAMAVRE